MLGRGARRAPAQRRRLKVSRLIAGGAAVLLVFTAISCSSSGNGSPVASAAVSPSTGSLGAPASTLGGASTPHVISIPTGQLSAYAKCMLGLGWQITAVHTASALGDPVGYDFTAPGNGDSQGLFERTRTQCEPLRPSPREKTDAEIRDIYTRWVGEYHCLVGLGYQPDAPPSVETFIATWKSTGPWSPINGLHTEHWTQAEYDQAKAKCTLDMFSDDRYQQ